MAKIQLPTQWGLTLLLFGLLMLYLIGRAIGYTIDTTGRLGG